MRALFNGHDAARCIQRQLAGGGHGKRDSAVSHTAIFMHAAHILYILLTYTAFRHELPTGKQRITNPNAAKPAGYAMLESIDVDAR